MWGEGSWEKALRGPPGRLLLTQKGQLCRNLSSLCSSAKQKYRDSFGGGKGGFVCQAKGKHIRLETQELPLSPVSREGLYPQRR